MKNIKILSVLLLTAVVLFSGTAFAGWKGGSGDNYGEMQETIVAQNNSGTTLMSGMVVVIDTTATAGTTLGAYVTTTTTADASGVVGIIKNVQGAGTFADGMPLVIVTRGPVQAKCQDSSDPVTAGRRIGTSTVAGECGGYGAAFGSVNTSIGTALASGGGTNGEFIWVWLGN